MNSKIKANENIKFLIQNTNQPIVFSGLLDWELIKWDLAKWNTILESETLRFRCGENKYTSEPQWETFTRTLEMRFNGFIKHQEIANSDKWLYFDYKYLRDWFKKISVIRNNVSWKSFGFPEHGADESTIWIGTTGAHTPCHVDTYGCNLVAQIFGRKQWLLFPPEENLQPTRVPYEESSIYSKLNFFSPDLNKFKGVDNCRMIVLNPGDVLLLPHGWWHYVENLETAISINIWLPMKNDNKQRIKESVVQMLIAQITKDLTSEERQQLINPNNENDCIHTKPLTELMSVVDVCLKMYKNEQNDKKIKTDCASKSIEPTNDACAEEMISKFENINIVPKLSTKEFHELLELKANRFKSKLATKERETEEEINHKKISKIVNSIVSPDVIDLIVLKLLND